jgi:hypothetical protein
MGGEMRALWLGEQMHETSELIINKQSRAGVPSMFVETRITRTAHASGLVCDMLPFDISESFDKINMHCSCLY